jgi:flagellar motor component MotA
LGDGFMMLLLGNIIYRRPFLKPLAKKLNEKTQLNVHFYGMIYDLLIIIISSENGIEDFQRSDYFWMDKWVCFPFR